MRHTERGQFARRKKGSLIIREMNIGLLQDFPQIRLLKRDLGLQTVGALEAQSSDWLKKHGVDVQKITRYLWECHHYQITFASGGEEDYVP